MPNGTPDDRTYYHQQFARLHERLDEIISNQNEFRVACIERHRNDVEVGRLVMGNGKPSLAVRLDRLEQAEPRKEKSTSFWMAVLAIATSAAVGIVEWLKK